MKLFSVLKYIKGYWNFAILNIIFNILFSVFSVVSITLIFPFLKLLTSGNDELLALYNTPRPEFSILKASSYVFTEFNYQITRLIFINGSVQKIPDDLFTQLSPNGKILTAIKKPFISEAVFQYKLNGIRFDILLKVSLV